MVVFVKNRKFACISGLMIGLLHCSCLLFGQQVKLDNLKEQFSKDKLFRINGGLSANTVFYNGSNAGRQSFIWGISGNVNISLFNQIDLPFNCNFNNLGGNYTYPTMPNRLSLHPTYKWATAHIGDVSMSLSPYTLNGHQFTGVGLELLPESFPLKLSVMYGRLLKATEYDSLSRLSTVAYKRMGYGLKVGYEGSRYAVGMSFFRARDDRNSLHRMPDSLFVYPQGNVAFSWDVSAKVIDNLTLNIEYGISSLTRDIRIASSGNNFFEQLVGKNMSTVRFHAVKAGVNYQFKKNTLGLGYERVDPGYQTLGAYYFTNDLENFTLNFTRPFLKDKFTAAVSMGMQHDNLNREKREQTNRWVGSLNLNFAPNEKWNSSFVFSTFQSYRHIRSQFDDINATNQYENLDTLDFTQLSQNISLNVAYLLTATDKRSQNLNLTLSYQEAADKRGDVIHPGSASRFYNLAVIYGLLFIPQGVQLTSSVNLTYNTIGLSRMLTCGPNVGASSKLFKKRISLGVSASYNATMDCGTWLNGVLNLRCNTGWEFYKKHHVTLALVHQQRSVADRPATSDFTSTLNYSYNF